MSARHASPTPVQLHVIILIRYTRDRSLHSNAFTASLFAFSRQFNGMGAEWQIIAARDIRIELTRARISSRKRRRILKAKLKKDAHRWDSRNRFAEAPGQRATSNDD